MEGLDWLRPEVIGALVAALSAVYKLPGGRTVLRIKRTANFTKLLSGNRWRSCHPAMLQLAVEQAFGMLLDDREIKWALERHNPVRIFRDRAHAVGIVHWDAQAHRYADDRVVKGVSLNFWIKLEICVLVLLWGLGVCGVGFSLVAGRYGSALAIAAEMLLISLAIFDSLRANAGARRLLDGARHPPIAVSHGAGSRRPMGRDAEERSSIGSGTIDTSTGPSAGSLYRCVT